MKLNLSLRGYDVSIAADGISGLKAWKEMAPDLIVLDIMLPHIDGISVLQSIRLDNERIPILIVSAKGEPDDRIKGFRHGVDDYLAKPFNLDEFLLRIERLLTRTSWYDDERAKIKKAGDYLSGTYSFGGNVINLDTGAALCKAGSVTLTEQEIKLLKLFIANKGKSLSRQTLLQVCWGYTRETATRTLDNFIVRFRRYFEDNPQEPVFFKSRRSVGYIFDHDNIDSLLKDSPI
ncbi:MAG: response regulator transcription factor [Deltaproteobacteria bacterium]|nr:response regulator transcription factor [Deltaproteobacteria bacterium]